MLTDGDAAFLRVNNRVPAHALQPGEVAAASNCRFERGKPGPRYGVGLDQWGICRNMVSGSYPDTGGLGPYPNNVVVNGFVVGNRYLWIPGNSDGLATQATLSIEDIFVDGPVFQAAQTTYYLQSIQESMDGVRATDIIIRFSNTCAYERFSDPFTDSDNGILLTDDVRDGGGEDGGVGRAWRIIPGNVPQEIPLNGHDVWGTARLVQCGNALLLLRHGNQRYYFSASAVNDATNDRIQLNVAPPWALNTGLRVRFDLASTGAAIFGTSPPAAGNYYYAKHITGDKIELYTDEAMSNKLDFEITTNPPTGRFFLEEAANPAPYFGNGARPLIMQPDDTGQTPFAVGFDWVLENVEITDTDATAELITAPNHRLNPGDSVSGTVITGVTWPKFAAPQSEHTLRLYDSAAEAQIDGTYSVAVTDTDLTTDVVTTATHGLTTADAITISGVTGVTAGTTYYARVLSSTTLTVHPTAADATNNTNIVNLTVNDQTGTLVALEGLVNLGANNETGSLHKTSAASVPLPPCREGAYVNGRFIGINERDTIVISDPNDFLHCTVWQATLPANQGESGRANWIVPIGDGVIVVGKDLNVIGIAGLDGAPSGWTERNITREYNGLAALAALQIGTDVWFASRKGLASIIRTVAGETLGNPYTVSKDIPKDLEDIDWGRANLMCAETWNNRLFWSVPTRGQETPVNNKTLVLNFLNSKLRVNQTAIAGDIVGGIVETDAGEASWEGTWTGDLLTPYNYAKLTVNGEERLTFATPDGLVCWLHDGWDDAGAAIVSEVLTRGYFGGRPVLVLRGKINHDTYDPSITASLVSAGVNEEAAFSGFDPLTYDRTQYTFHGATDYDPATSTETTFNARGREDYSPADGELAVATLDVHQNLTEPFHCRQRGTAPQVRYTNTQGSARLGAVAMQAKPIGISGRET